MSASHQQRKGNSYDRRARRAWLLSAAAPFGGDGTTVTCVHGCGTQLTADTIQVDRIIPGGSYGHDNIQPACWTDNTDRSNKLDWTPRHLLAPSLTPLPA
jgi:hypothetical protein